jgi:hypothetical protein
VKRFTCLAAALAAFTALAACDTPTAPIAAADPAPPPAGVPLALGAATATASTVPSPALEALLDGSFAFLPPLPAGEAWGEFDGGVLPVLEVQVCDVPSCDGAWTLSHTSTTGPAAQTIRLVEDDELFILNWRPSEVGLPSPAAYRIRVLAGGLELGSATVQLSSGGARNAATGEELSLQDNRTLPVKFSVRRNPVLAALVAADGGATASEIAELLVTEFGAGAGETALILAALGYPAIDVGGVLADVFGLTAAQAVPVLQGVGATADDIGVALATAFDQTLEEIGSLLAANGFDPEAILGALYRVGVDILNDPVDFALGTAMATMRGLGYAFDAFKGALLGGIQEWTKENIVDAFGISGFSLAELVPFMLDVLDLTVATLMDKVAGWGVELPDLVGALMDAGAAVDEIVAGAIAAFDATAEAIGQALADAGATALEIGASLLEAFDQTIDEIAAALKDLGFDGEATFNALYEIGVRILEDPVDFALGVALTAMKGAGYSFDSFKGALIGGLREWTQENLVDGLGISGFSIAELSSFMIDALGLTAGRMAEIAAGWGVPVQEFADAMAAAGQQVADFADAMMDAYALTEAGVVAALQKAGYAAGVVGDWVFAKLDAATGLGLELGAKLLADAGYGFEEVAGWVWNTAGRVPDAAAKALRFAGYSAKQVTAFLFNTAGRSAQAIFGALHKAGYAAAEAARAVYDEAGASIVAIGGWLAEVYGLGLDATAAILHELGATLGDLIAVLLDVYEASLEEATALLVGFGYSVADIIAAWS